jgi:nitrogen fixation protein FixH
MAVVRRPGWWYPYIFVALFMVVLMVNLTMAFFASSTFSGLATEHPYEKGLAYNQNLAMAKAQDAMGWTVELKVEPVEAGGGAAHRTRLAIGYLDRDGKPVEGLDVRAQLIRPTAKGYDRQISLPAGPAGTYGAIVELPLQGVWDFEAVAVGKDATYQFARRIVVP